MISDKLKKIIFDELYFNLSDVEIICYDKSIWFIDVSNNFWYFQYTKGTLWYRYDFFDKFFKFFSLNETQFKDVLLSWIQEIINDDAIKVKKKDMKRIKKLEESLNYKVTKFYGFPFDMETTVKEITQSNLDNSDEKVLICEVFKSRNKVLGTNDVSQYRLNEVLSKWRD